MDFISATDHAAGACITLADIAEACGASDNAVRRARLKKNGDSYRSPPPGWQKCLAKLAKERAGELLALAEELER